MQQRHEIEGGGREVDHASKTFSDLHAEEKKAKSHKSRAVREKWQEPEEVVKIL